MTVLLVPVYLFLAAVSQKILFFEYHWTCVTHFLRIKDLFCLSMHVSMFLQLQEEEKHLLQRTPPGQSDHDSREPSNSSGAEDSLFIFPHTRSRPSVPPIMPTLPEEEEDSPEELDSSSSSPSTVSAHTVIL